MAIIFNEQARTFKLDTNNTSYVFKINEFNYPVHCYYGAKISDNSSEFIELLEKIDYAFSPYPDGGKSVHSLNTLLSEFPTHDVGDFRLSAAILRDASGANATCAKFVSYKISQVKTTIPDMPSSFTSAKNPCEVLEIVLLDEVSKIEYTLYYNVFAETNVITRYVKVKNLAATTAYIERIMSATLDFYGQNYDLLQLSGAWARERHLIRTPLRDGVQSISSTRTSTGHNHNNAFAVAKQETTENCGDIYGFMLVYSGNFVAEVELDAHNSIRIATGINENSFEWKLASGEEFFTPECLMTFSANGITGMSANFHDFIRTSIINPKWQTVKRPILINNWEATYFNFDKPKLLAIAKDAAKLGIEMLVLDDGWFGHRESDNSSLGDWFVNENKIGQLKELVDEINDLGLKFGLWFEPEMISYDSELYKNHPGWVIAIPNREKTQARQQMVLNMALPEVVDYLADVVGRVIASANIYYIKWDMNRQITEKFLPNFGADQQKEMGHRYVLGVYELHRRLLERFPDLLIEGCSGGGGRFDAGMLYYAPQIWTSDDTDAFERIKIQFGTSIFYPASTMGAHVSASPNHQTERASLYKTRGDVALFGTFGYELDLTTLTPEEQALTRIQVTNYHDFNHMVNHGNLYRLTDAFDDKNYYNAWEFAEKDASEAVVIYVLRRQFPEIPPVIIRLKGLEPHAKYQLVGSDKVYFGDTLMNFGFVMTSAKGDGCSSIFHFKKL